MKKNSKILCIILLLLIGGIAGSGITYYLSKCQTHETKIQFGSDKNAAGITIQSSGEDN